jgi:hypothetical protein
MVTVRTRSSPGGSGNQEPILCALDDNVAHLLGRNFAASTEQLRRFGYAEIPALAGGMLARLLQTYAVGAAENGLLTSGDSQVPYTPAKYGEPIMETVLEQLCPVIERAAQLQLYPTYSYFRVYKSGDTLPPHTDRSACELSVSMALGIESREPWPLFIQGKEGVARIVLEPGDAVIYRGIECMHWREGFDGRYCAQLFLHYVRRDGRNALHKFDGRQCLSTDRR